MAPDRLRDEALPEVLMKAALLWSVAMCEWGTAPGGEHGCGGG
jgi:hypothetical protein